MISSGACGPLRRNQRERLGLRPAESAVGADEFFERSDLAGLVVEHADDIDVWRVVKAAVARKVRRRVLSEVLERVDALDFAAGEPLQAVGADRDRAVRRVDHHESDSRVRRERRDQPGVLAVDPLARQALLLESGK